MKHLAYCLAAAGITMIPAAPAFAAEVVYSNGPLNGTAGGYLVNSGYAVTNSFALASQATITGFSFGGWTFPGDSIASISYGFSANPDYLITGTTSLALGPVIPTSASGWYDIRSYSADISPIMLAAGTYYFSLQNAATTTQETPAYWDANFGPSVALQNGDSISSSSFALFATQRPDILDAQEMAAVPEPSTWAMMLVGFGAIGSTMRRRQKFTIKFHFA